MSNVWVAGITDRAASDITGRTAKAFFNVADWLRVYGNSEIANQLVNAYLALSVPFTALTAPTITSFPTVTEINNLVENIDLLRAAAYLPAATGILVLDYAYTEGPGGTAPDYTDVNAWENDLELIRTCLRNAMEQVIYCGVGACGQARLWQVRFRTWSFVPPAASPTRRPRCGLIACGSDLTRQNFWRNYS